MVILTAACNLSAGEPGKDTPPARDGAPPATLTVEALTERVNQLEKAGTPDEETRKKLIATYKAAIDQLQQADRHKAETAAYQEAIRTVPERIKVTSDALAEPVPPPQIDAPPDMPVAQMQLALAREKAQLATVKAALKQLEDNGKQRATRRIEVPALLTATREEADNLALALRTALPEKASESDTAERMRLRARKLNLDQWIQSYEHELRSYDATRDLSPLLRDLAARKTAHQEKLVEAWDKAVGETRQDEAQRAAQRARRQAALSHPALRTMAEENTKLAETRTGSSGLAARIKSLSADLDATVKQREALDKKLKSLQQRIEAAGVTRAVGLLLLRERADLPDLVELSSQRKVVQEKLSSVQVEWLKAEEERSRLSVVDDRVREIVEDLGRDLDEPTRQDMAAEAKGLLLTKRQLLDALISDYDTYFGRLVEFDNEIGGLIRFSERFRSFVDEHVLWIRSARPLNIRTFTDAGEGLGWMVQPSAAIRLSRTILEDLRSNPVVYALALLILVGLMVGRRKLLHARRVLNAKVAQHRSDRYVYTVQALLIAILAYGLVPSIPLFFSWRLSVTEGYAVLNRAVAAGLLAAGLHFLACNLMRGLCAPRGIAEAHFRIPKVRTELYRWHITWYMTFGLPMVFLAATFYLTKDDWQNSIGRFSSMLAWLCQGLLFLMVFRPNGPIMSSLAKAGRKSWIHSLRYVLASLVVLVTVTVIFRAADGYYYGARYTAWCLEMTAVLLLSIWLLWHMVNRWLAVLWGRWQAAERAAARDTKPVAQEPPGSRTEIFNVPREAEEASRRAPREQTDRFVRFAMMVLLFAGLWLIWSDVLPAVNSIKRIELWSFAEQTTGGTEAVSITLGGVTLAAIILVFSFLAAMNLPGFLEIAVLQHLPIDQGIRFAVCALSRYAIGVIGIMVACGQLGVGWSKVQLPVAAMTIGLGFGLQEIVGNFVAGIIVLLEQPIRVGDTVTLGDATGVVTKVRIRATTLQQWDRKELLVPNKEFITGRLINWTLTDDILRLEFPVGIAYGSDTRKAERVLYQVARANEDVLLTPTPFVAFLGFGDSALDFELRVFINTSKPNGFILTRHRINRAIDDAFREAGIEIAFPQRDLHLRSAREPLRVQMDPKQKQYGSDEEAQPNPPTAGG